MLHPFTIRTSNPMDFDHTQPSDNLKHIDEVIREILATGIPESPQRLQVMIVILGETSCIQDNRIRFAVWCLQQDLIQIAAIYQSCEIDS